MNNSKPKSNWLIEIDVNNSGYSRKEYLYAKNCTADKLNKKLTNYINNFFGSGTKIRSTSNNGLPGVFNEDEDKRANYGEITEIKKNDLDILKKYIDMEKLK